MWSQHNEEKRTASEPGTVWMIQDECFTPCLIDLSTEYPKASGTVLMGLKKKRLG